VGCGKRPVDALRGNRSGGYRCGYQGIELFSLQPIRATGGAIKSCHGTTRFVILTTKRWSNGLPSPRGQATQLSMKGLPVPQRRPLGSDFTATPADKPSAIAAVDRGAGGFSNASGSPVRLARSACRPRMLCRRKVLLRMALPGWKRTSVSHRQEV